MSPIFKCLICRKDIERSTKSFWNKKGHLLCSTCLDKMHKKSDDIPEPPMPVMQDNNLLGVIFIVFYLMQIAWMLRPILIC